MARVWKNRQKRPNNIMLIFFVFLGFIKGFWCVTYNCTFEADDVCFLHQDKSDDFDWTFPKKGKTKSHSTGPDFAMEGISYAYIETSSPRRRDDKAVLVSNSLSLTETLCLTFNYHMYGRNMGTLNVWVYHDSGNTKLWSKSGNQRFKWYQAGIQISPNVFATSSMKISFEGVRGSGTKGDAAIDNIVLTPGTCINGNWGSWGTWSSCSVTCGDGSKSRTRQCDNPAPGYDGSDCTGEDVNTVTCTLSPCPVDGGWASWRTWSKCSVVNEAVLRTRCRKCTNPIPQYGGEFCSGDQFMSNQCNSTTGDVKRKCRCRRARMPVIRNITVEELAEIMEETKEKLTVDKKQTAMAVRKKISVADTRMSSVAMGILGVVMITLQVSFLVGIDLVNIYRFLSEMRKSKVRP